MDELDRLRVDITGGFAVPGEKDNGRKVIDFCAEKGLSVSNTLSTGDCRSTPGWLEPKMERMIDLVMVKKTMLHYVQDVRAVRGMGRGLSNHRVLVRKVRFRSTWIN